MYKKNGYSNTSVLGQGHSSSSPVLCQLNFLDIDLELEVLLGVKILLGNTSIFLTICSENFEIRFGDK